MQGHPCYGTPEAERFRGSKFKGLNSDQLPRAIVYEATTAFKVSFKQERRDLSAVLKLGQEEEEEDKTLGRPGVALSRPEKPSFRL